MASASSAAGIRSRTLKVFRSNITTARQALLNNAMALARTAAAFSVPVVVSTSASRVYSGPLLPALQDGIPAVKAIERKPMNVWEDDTGGMQLSRPGGVHAQGRREI